MRKKCLSAIFVETNICGTLQNYTVKIIGELAMSNVCNVFSKCVNVRWATEKRQKKRKLHNSGLFAQVIALCYFRVFTINVVICQRSLSTVDKSLKT